MSRCIINVILHKWHLTILDVILFKKIIYECEEKILSYKNGNKLRTYKFYKDNYCVESYLRINMPLCHRSVFAKFRCGVVPYV